MEDYSNQLDFIDVFNEEDKVLPFITQIIRAVKGADTKDEKKILAEKTIDAYYFDLGGEGS